jgi:DNA-directed RNA polymerase specialized sigma24 family protein
VSSKEANERRLAAMTDADLHDLLDRATAFADRLVRSKNWRGLQGGVLPAGKSVQDLVQAAFEKILEGAKWDEDKDLAMVLGGIIRGTVKNLVESWENRNFSNPDDHEGPEEEDGWVSAVDRFASSEETADRKISRKEDEDLLLNVIETLKEGSEERRIVEAIVFSGVGKRAEVLAETGLSAKEYEAAKKRLQRFLENYRRESATAHQ